jgi:hypothetical protein
MIVTVDFYNYGLVDWKCCVTYQSIIARNKGDMDEYEKHRIKAPKLLLPYLNLFLYTSG